ncbi:uncharacterized protein [Physcomitrium patens]|uniref:Uncharacterized protein n=1 Tax=Physcomitrium patens TaxID=3218 RepID=A0A2K1IYJ9_PHYPA|nr:uncharacterized protein LOC112272636 [Physcomitrium patens]PNR34352.1 hypothetical protein PHYPA_024169 [Physcomitrium patens]|eukprot:XP_024356364.1 uncharacterized protein LOC112272636 [Physcomitrella patens]
MVVIRARVHRMTTKKMYRYTKDTLLAFATLPSCQTRPDGIDPVLWSVSINSDVVEGNIAIPVVPSARGLVRRDCDLAYSKSPVDDLPEWRRPNGGGAILQSGPRRKPYEEEPLGNAFSSSYPPRPSGPWVEHNGPPRPPHDRLGPNGPPGRWDRNGDKDRERGRHGQEWDADEGGSGGKGDASPRPWVERDGLLGSGNRPPPQAHTRVGRPADNYQPSRPRVKAPVYGRREDTDIVNDETFGFLESSHDDRSDQERKRREAFELMRKEQHRHVQEQKQSLTKSGKSAVNLKHDENSLWDNPSHQSPPLSPVPKTAITPVPTPPRPAVPPGFSNVLQQRLNSNQTPLQQNDAQGNHGRHSKDDSVKDQNLLDPDKTGDPSARSSSSIADIKEIKIATPVAKMNVDSDVETKVVVTEATKDNTRNDSLSSEGSLERKRSAGLPDMWSFNLEGQDLDSVSDILSTEDASSIRKESLLDKLFGNAAPTTIDDFALPSDLSKNEPLIPASDEENWSGSLSKASKFAHWFHAEEDKFTTSQTSSSKNLMSLFGSSEHTKNSAPLEKDIQSIGGLGSFMMSGFNVLPMPVGPSLEGIEKGLANMVKVPNPNNHTVTNNSFTENSIAQHKQVPNTPPVFMTCEDIEQALLAEAAGSGPQLETNTPLSLAEEETPPKSAASASQHLLSLILKKPPTLEAGLPSKVMDMEDTSAKPSVEQAWKKSDPSNNQINEVHTLASLFGKAFLNELQTPEAAAPVRMFLDDGLAIQESELEKASFPMHNGEFNTKTRSNGMGGPRDWFASSGPGWNSMWPDSNDVEAGGHVKAGHALKESHLNRTTHEDFEDRTASAPSIPGLWRKPDATNDHNNVFMDNLNGATPNFGGTTLQTHDEVVTINRTLPAASMQHLGSSLGQPNQQRAQLGSANVSFPHPSFRQQAHGPLFNSNGLDGGFDGFSAPHIIQPPSHSFPGSISHPPTHIMGQPQMLQRPQLHHYGMVVQEQESFKPQLSAGTGSVLVPAGQHMHEQQRLSNPVPSGGLLGPFQPEFQMMNSKSTTPGGYGGDGGVERWFGVDGRRSAHLGPMNMFPQAPLGVEGDMLRY